MRLRRILLRLRGQGSRRKGCPRARSVPLNKNLVASPQAIGQVVLAVDLKNVEHGSFFVASDLKFPRTEICGPSCTEIEVSGLGSGTRRDSAIPAVKGKLDDC